MGVDVSAPVNMVRAGDVVIVRRGKYAGRPFAVIGSCGDRILIANGSDYKTARPKKKNIIHLQQTHYNLVDVAERVAAGKPLDNGWLILQLSNVCGDNSDASCEREDEAAGWPKKR